MAFDRGRVEGGVRGLGGVREVRGVGWYVLG